MPSVSKASTLVLSIEGEPSSALGHLEPRRTVESAGLKLLAWLAPDRIPATWALAESAGHPLAEAIIAPATHELALLGDAAWADPQLPRTTFAGELANRLLRASVTGSSPSSLVLHDGGVPEAQWDLLVRYGVTALRAPSTTTRRLGFARGLGAGIGRWLVPARHDVTTAVRSLRWGVWEMTPSVTLPDAGARAAERALKAATRHGGYVHLAIDLTRCSLEGHGLNVVERVIRAVRRWHDEDLLQVTTMADLVAQIWDARQGRPSRSILREVA